MEAPELRHVFLVSLKQLLRAKYGLAVTSQRQLDGYVDENVWVDVSVDVENPYIEQTSVDGYVVKLINEKDSRTPSLLDARMRLMLHVIEDGIPTPLPVRTVTGSYTSSVDLIKSGKVAKRQMIVLTYIEGHVLSDLSVTPSVIQELGNLSGKLNIRMQSFADSGALDYASIWKLSQIGQLQGLIHYAPSEKLRTLASKIISEFNLLVMTRVQEFQTVNPIFLPKGLIHHDMGLQNIVMRRNDTNSTWQVAAILDFGDVCTSCYVFEVAILISNIFMNELSRSLTTDRMASTRDMVLESYTSVLPLLATEKSVLDICIITRILQCSLLGEKARESDPGNVYIGNYICWGFLDKLDGESKIPIRQDDEEAKTLLIPNNV